MLSWNTVAPSGSIELRVLRAHRPATPWLLHAQWSPQGRRSFSPAHDDVRVEVDVIRSLQPFDGIEVRAPGVTFAALAFAAPEHRAAPPPFSGRACVLDVPARSQYVCGGERGWCSPTSLSMLNAFFGVDYDVPATARAVFDRAYNGTGNWSFNVAFSGSLGLRAAVIYLPNLTRAQRFIEAGIPLALSYRWSDGELAGAPLEHSDGHLVVLRGFTENGDCAVNDPAHPQLRAVYAREAIERVWGRNNGVAYAVAPDGFDLAALANAADDVRG